MVDVTFKINRAFRMAALAVLSLLCVAALGGTAIAAAGSPGKESKDLKISVKYPILPISRQVAQEIEIELSPQASNEGAAFETIVTSASGYGVLLSGGTPTTSGKILCRPGEPIRLGYRWSGAIPTDAPIEEKIEVKIPALNISAHTTFSVGVDIRVREIILPEHLESGRTSTIEVVLHDALHPETDIAPLIAETGETLELALTLIQDRNMAASSSAQDPVVSKFFGRTEKRPLELTYPGPEFKQGMVGRDIEGRNIWRSVDGREPSLTLPAPGEYRITAMLRVNTGGTTMREHTSPAFESGGARGVAHGLPQPIASSVEIIAGLNAGMAIRAADEIRGLLDANKKDDANTTLGIYLASIASPTPVQMIGRYVHALTASGQKIDDLTPFIQRVLSGYGEYGALILTKEGVKSWKAADSQNNPYTPAPAGRVYEDDRYIVIPFLLGVDFNLTIEGAGKGAVALWKIIPPGVNKKTYAQGNWTKSVAVHTGVLTPPPPNKRY